MKNSIILAVLVLLFSPRLFASSVFDPTVFFYQNFGQMKVYREKCPRDSERDNSEEGGELSLFGHMLYFGEKYYPYVLTQEGNSDLSMTLRSESQRIAFISTHSYESSGVRYNDLVSVSTNESGGHVSLAPILFDEGKNIIYEGEISGEFIHIESFGKDGRSATRIYGRHQGDGKGYFRVLFQPALRCRFSYINPSL